MSQEERQMDVLVNCFHNTDALLCHKSQNSIILGLEGNITLVNEYIILEGDFGFLDFYSCDLLW